ncbi:ATP-binding cassette domain-containing protein [Trebonia kvetii]|uniref:ATP-binding cassette domain-containing protein n=1 Tax=Trebonia kvetii TaxID=2480626 RepID=A0A6P2C1G5_9ACTN|nr:branched-chain amino acid ABC transporter permease/ATP-binding protein [Trebonia kvetii]TVZ05232.1 ATP-binding cassette domain-containing protein [Trebonia kvetii]
METVLLFILLGLGSGALIAGIGLGVVATYRGSGVINLSTGAIAMLGGYAFWSLTSGKIASLPHLVALPLALLFVLAVGALLEFAVYRPLRNASPLGKLIASLGVLLIAQSSMLLAFGVTQQASPSVLPTKLIHMLGSGITLDRFLLAAIVIAATAVLAAVYQWTKFGLATRAASENEVAAMLGGVSPGTISLSNSLIAAFIAGSLGILASSVTQLDPSTLPLQIIPALAAALIARFTSFGLVTVAAFGIGILDSLLQLASSEAWFPQSGGVAIPGTTDLLAFLIIIGVLFWRGARIPGRGEVLERRLPEAPRPQHLWRSALIFGGGAAVLLVVFPFDFRNALINTLIGILMALSLVVITGFVGQISIIQLALAGAAGFTISHMASNFGITFPLAALAGIAVAVAIGVVTAISAVRVRGVSLAVVTLAGAVAINSFGFQNTTWGGGGLGSPVPEMNWFGLDLGPNAGFRGIDGNQPSPVFGWVVLIFVILACVGVGYLRRGKLGQQMLAVRSNERAAAAAAINPRTVKLYAFSIAAFIAGVAGCLYAYNFGSVSSDRFDAFTALSLIAFAYAGGITLISGAVFAGLISAQAMIPYALDKWFGLNGNWFLLFGGVILIFTLLGNPTGVAGDFYRRTHKKARVKAPEVDAATRERITARTERRDLSGHQDILAIDGLSVRFGGVHALSDVSLRVKEGELLGLIGPNGAGKTTLIDAISGFVTATGTVSLGQRDLRGLAAHDRARAGLTRTWQSTELFDDLSVLENLTVAAKESGVHEDDAKQTLALVGMEWAAEAEPSQLSSGQRKLVGVARALVAKPKLLCLDEPAAGLDNAESQELGVTLRRLADQGQSMLLIEHDMGLVLGICDRVVVLEFGKVIAEGTPEQVRRDPKVIAAYLGDGMESAASGPAGDSETV